MKTSTIVLTLIVTSGLLLACNNQTAEETLPLNGPSNEPSDEPTAQDKIDLYATMLAFNPNDGFNRPGEIAKALEEGWLNFSSNEDVFSNYLSDMKNRFEPYIAWAEETGFSIDREIPGAFAWNVIEPAEGEGYHWNISDLVVESVNAAGMSLSALIQPFAAWDQDSIPEGCEAIDFAYYDYKADTPTDWEAYQAFLTATVERYDGDGEDDMPGLLYPVKYWEIGNEYDGKCGGDLNEAENYFELMKVSSQTIRAPDPEARVLTMGALEINSDLRDQDVKGFWEDFFALGGGETIDIFNFHYNREKFGMASSSEEFEEHLEFFNETMKVNDAVKPMWITEFGTYSGSPATNTPPGGNKGGEIPGSPTQSEAAQSAWYFRYSILAFAQGVEKIFVDLQGQDNSTIGGSSLYNEKGEARDFLYTIQALAQTLEGFESVEKLAEGQYLFVVDGVKVYALWEGDLPEEIESEVEVMRISGESTIMNSSDIELSEENPILLTHN